MLKLGIVRPSKSPWASPLLLRNKDGTDEVRPCGDYYLLNLVTTPDHYRLPNMKDAAARLTSSTIFSVLDITKAFFHIPVLEEDIPKTAVITPFGLFEYTRMPFGLRNAPQTQQRFMDNILRDFDFVFSYIDDILIFSRDETEHERHIRAILQVLSENGRTINAKKCQFGQTSLKFLGYQISARGIESLSEKIDVLQNMPLPARISDLRRALGAFNHYRDHVPNLLKISSPLYEILKGRMKRHDLTTIEWTDKLQRAFDNCKKGIANRVKLFFPNPEYPITLTTDASDIGIGAVLHQINPEGIKEPLGFFSKKLSDQQKLYPTYNKELLAIYEAIRYFQPYLEGHADFVIYIDHKPLTYTVKKSPISIKQYNAHRASQFEYIA